MSGPDRREFLAQSAGAMAAMAIVPKLTLGGMIRLPEPLSVAVVGAGRQGRAILGELQKVEDLQVVAICDRDESRLQSGLRRARGAEGFSDHRAMLDGMAQASAIFVATPTHEHRAVAVDALSAGRHVYCEGPLASTIDDCTAIARAAREAKSVFQCGLQGRSNPVYGLARSFYRSGSLRELISTRAQAMRKTSWRTPADDPERERLLNWRLDPERSIGLVGEWGTQQFDVIHWFTGVYPTAVSGSGRIRVHDDGRAVPDTIECRLEFPNDTTLQYEASLGSSYDGNYELIRGSNASMKLAWSHGWMFKEADAPTQGWEVYANRQQFHNDEGITLIAEATKLAAQGKLKDGVGLPNPPLHYAIGDFLKSVAEDEPVACTADEGRRATIVGILANQAVMSGARVEIPSELMEG